MGDAKKAYRLPVGGEWIEDVSLMAVIDKYTGEVIGTVPVAPGKTVDKALAAGNTIVLKPASTTPLTAIRLADDNRQPLRLVHAVMI